MGRRAPSWEGGGAPLLARAVELAGGTDEERQRIKRGMSGRRLGQRVQEKPCS